MIIIFFMSSFLLMAVFVCYLVELRIIITTWMILWMTPEVFHVYIGISRCVCDQISKETQGVHLVLMKQNEKENRHSVICWFWLFVLLSKRIVSFFFFFLSLSLNLFPNNHNEYYLLYFDKKRKIIRYVLVWNYENHFSKKKNFITSNDVEQMLCDDFLYTCVNYD